MKVIVVGGIPESLVRFRGQLIARFVELGWEVVAMAGHENPATTAELARLGARFESFPLGRTRTGPLEDLATCRALLRRFRAESPDLVLAYTAKPVVWGGIAARLEGRAAFHALVTGLGGQFGGQFAAPGRGRWLGAVLERLYRFALGGARTVTFQNEDDRRLFVERGLVDAERTRHVHGSGVDLAAYPVRPPPDGPVVFLMVARLLVAKGIREYAAAARRVRARHPEARFVLVGPPESGAAALPLAEIEAWAAEGLVEHRGSLPDVREALAECHVFVLPSYYGEGVPRTILEAMATGRPVLTTDNVGCRDAVEDGVNGRVVPPRDAAALAAAAIDLIEDPGGRARMGRAGRALAESRYDVHRVNDALVAILGIDPASPTKADRNDSEE